MTENFFTKERALREKATKLPWQHLKAENCIHKTGEWEHQGNVPPAAVVCVAQGWDELGRPEPRIQLQEHDAEYIVFAVNNMARVSELLERALIHLRKVAVDRNEGGAEGYYGGIAYKCAEEIQAALEKL